IGPAGQFAEQLLQLGPFGADKRVGVLDDHEPSRREEGERVQVFGDGRPRRLVAGVNGDGKGVLLWTKNQHADGLRDLALEERLVAVQDVQRLRLGRGDTLEKSKAVHAGDTRRDGKRACLPAGEGTMLSPDSTLTAHEVQDDAAGRLTLRSPSLYRMLSS